MSNTEKTLERYSKLEGEKATYLSLWQEIGEFCYPSQQDFTRYLSSGHKRRRVIFDNTAERALDIFASSMIGLLANPATKWINLQHQDPSINQLKVVQEFFDEAQNKIISVFNNPRAKFYDNLYSCLKTLGAFGVAPMMIEADDNMGAKFKAESPKGYNFTEDFSGNVDEHFFEKEFTVKALRDKGWDLPQEYSLKAEDEKVMVLRHVFKNPDADITKVVGVEIPNKKYFDYKGAYYLKADKKLIYTDYFRTDPIALARWDRIAGEKWSDSPARVALGDVKVVNAYERMAMVAIEKQISPPIVISSESKFGKLDTSAGGVNVARGGVAGSYDLMTTNGNLAQPFQWAELKKQQIRSAFYVDVFQSAETPDMTATEAAIRQQEKLRGLGPKMAKLQADLIEPIVNRVMSILINQGKLNPPKELDTGSVDVVYLSPVAQAQRGVEATSILQYLQDLSLVAQVDPTVIDKIDTDKIARVMAEVRGVPETILKDDKEVEEIRNQRAEQQQNQQTLNALQQGAEIGKTVGEAQQLQ